MNGLARFVYSYQDKINESVFKEKLGVVSIKDLTKTAKERKAGSLGFAEAMLIHYNKRLKNPLPWSDLVKIQINRKKYRKEDSVPDTNEEVENCSGD